MTYDFVIIGQGIAGTVLAMKLLLAGKKVFVINKEDKLSSSRVAAGLINPVTGKNVVKSWLANETFKSLHEFYPQMEDLLGSRFFYPKLIYKPYLSTTELNHIFSRSTPGDLGDFVSLEANNAFYSQYVKNPMGGFMISKGGYLDTNQFLDSAQKYFIDHKSYLNSEIDYDKIEILENGFEILNFKCENLVFCEGVNATQNPFFNYLPFRPCKGEVLTIQSESLKIGEIISKNGWILPLENQIFKVGATYENNFTDLNVSQKGRDALVEKAKDILKQDFEIVDQQVGVRPATLNRRPFVGEHPEIKNMYIFNGLGSKGVSLAPYFADQFIGNIFDGQSIHVECDTHSFINYFKSEN